MDTGGALVEHRARRIAQEYRTRGYEVVESPSQMQMPEFLGGYHPDFLCRKSDDAVVVAVRPRLAMTREPKIWELAELLRDRPGWRFDLVIVNVGDQLEIPEGSSPLTRREIRRRIAEAQHLQNAGSDRAAMLLAWSATEAIVRLLAEEEGWVAEHPTSGHVISAAVYHGAISKDDEQFLEHTLRCRNALAHGFTPPDFGEGLVEPLIGTATRLLETPPLD